jgi:beta-lactamase regulating signal transducer with metallopeptidase domain
MYDFFGLNAIVCERLTITLLHFLWQGVAVGIVAAVLGRMLLRASSQVRYMIHLVALLAMCCCVPLTFSLVKLREPAAFTSGSVDESPTDLATNVDLDSRSSTPLPIIEGNSIPFGPDGFSKATDSSDSPSRSYAVQESNVVPSSKTAALATERYLSRLAPYVTAFYLAGVALLLARLIRSGWLTRRIGRSASGVTNTDLLDRMQTQAERLGLRVLPALRWCQQVPMPVVIGVFRPIILLPAYAATGLTTDQLQAVLAHELAHIRRYDLLVNVLQRVIESLLFFHPAVWWVSRQIANEREQACDELVLTVGPGRTQYADALVRMAELSFQCVHPPLTALATTGSSTTAFKRRILKVLEIDTSPRIRPGRIAAVVASMVVLLTLAMLLVRGGALASGTTEEQDGGDSTEHSGIEDERAAWRELDRLKVMVAGSGRPGWSVNLEQAVERNDQKNVVKYQKLLDDIPTTADFWQIPSKAWPIIGRLRSLTDVRFVACDLQGQMIHLRQLQNLQKFELRSGQMLPDDLAELGALTNLEVIDVNLSTWFRTEEEIAALLATLSEEDQQYCELDGDFNRTKHRLSMVLTDAAIAKLRNLKQLKVLDLRHTFVTGKGVEALAHLQNLEQFTVDDLHLLTPASMKALGSLQKLRRIPELPSGATELIEPLAGMQKLEDLRISGQDLTDEGLSHLKNLSSLKRLHILHSQVTDAGLPQLANLKQLEELDMRGVDTVTAAGVQQLREQLPNCRIVHTDADYEASLVANNEAANDQAVTPPQSAEPRDDIKVGMTFDEVIRIKGRHYRPQYGKRVGHLSLYYDDLCVGVENHRMAEGGGTVFRVDQVDENANVEFFLGNTPYADAAQGDPFPQPPAPQAQTPRVELIGLTWNRATKHDAWQPNGHPTVVPEWALKLPELAPDSEKSANGTLFLYEFHGLKNTPSIYYHQRVAYQSGDGKLKKREPWRRAILYSDLMAMRFPEWGTPPALSLSDEEWGPWKTVTKEGRLADFEAEHKTYRVGYDQVTLRGVRPLVQSVHNHDPLPANAPMAVVQHQPEDFRERWAIEVEGATVGDATQPPQFYPIEPRFSVRFRNESKSEIPWEYEIDWPFDPKKIDHLRFRIRPYRHQFVFENVNFAPSAKVENYSPFKVVYKKLVHDLTKPMAADELRELHDRPRLHAEDEATARAELERLVAADPGHIHATRRASRNPNGWKWTLYLPPGKTWRLYSRSGLIPSGHDIQPTGRTQSYPIVRKDEQRIIELEGFISPNSRENGESQLWIEADRSILQGTDFAVWNIAPEAAAYINGQTENSGSITYFDLAIGGVTTLNAGRDQFRLVLTQRRYREANDKDAAEPELMPGFCVWVQADPVVQNVPAPANAYPYLEVQQGFIQNLSHPDQSIRDQAAAQLKSTFKPSAKEPWQQPRSERPQPKKPGIASPDPAPPVRKPFELQVVDDTNGEPIVGAEVNLRQTISSWQPERPDAPPVPDAVPESRVTLKTNDTGHFSFTIPAELRDWQSNLQVSVRHPDYVIEQSFGMWPVSREMAADPEVARHNLFNAGVISLKRGHEIRGQVNGPDGKPAVGVKLYAASQLPEYLDMPPHTVTNGDGKYKFHVPGHDRYHLFVIPTNAVARSIPIPEAYGELQPIQLERGTLINGQVLDWSGQPLVGVVVQANGSDSVYDGFLKPMARVLTDDQGRYNLPPQKLPLDVRVATLGWMGGWDEQGRSLGPDDVFMPVMMREPKDEKKADVDPVAAPGALVDPQHQTTVTLDFRPCETVTLTAKVYDEKGQPATGCELAVFGTAPDSVRAEDELQSVWRGRFHPVLDQVGLFRLKAPKGLHGAMFVDPEACTRAVRSEESLPGPRTEAGWDILWLDDDSIIVGNGELAVRDELPVAPVQAKPPQHEKADRLNAAAQPAPGLAEGTNRPLLDVLVVDAQTNQPVTKGKVTLRWSFGRADLETSVRPLRNVFDLQEEFDLTERGTFPIRVPAGMEGAKLQLQTSVRHTDYVIEQSSGYRPFTPEMAADPALAKEKLFNRGVIKLKRGYEVSGLVTDALEQPVAGVRVYAAMQMPEYMNMPPHALTDAQGRYKFRVSSYDEYWLMFVPADRDKSEINKDKPVNVTALAQMNLVAQSIPIREEYGEHPVIKLQSGTRIVGVVRDSAGKPLRNVVVQANGSDSIYTGFPIVMSRVATDAEGRYELPGQKLPVDVRIARLNALGGWSEPTRLPADVYLPAFVTERWGKPRVGEERVFDVDFAPVKSVTLRVRAYNAKGQPDTHADIALIGRVPVPGALPEQRGPEWRRRFEQVPGEVGLYELKAPHGLREARIDLTNEGLRQPAVATWTRAVREGEKSDRPNTNAAWPVLDQDDASIIVGQPAPGLGRRELNLRDERAASADAPPRPILISAFGRSAVGLINGEKLLIAFYTRGKLAFDPQTVTDRFNAEGAWKLTLRQTTEEEKTHDYRLEYHANRPNEVLVNGRAMTLGMEIKWGDETNRTNGIWCGLTSYGRCQSTRRWHNWFESLANDPEKSELNPERQYSWAWYLDDDLYEFESYRTTLEMDDLPNVVIAWDEQHPIQHSDAARAAKLRVLADGRVFASSNGREAAQQWQLTPAELNTLIEKLVPLFGDPLSPVKPVDSRLEKGGALWDAVMESMVLLHAGKTYRVHTQSASRSDKQNRLGIEPMHANEIRSLLEGLVQTAKTVVGWGPAWEGLRTRIVAVDAKPTLGQARISIELWNAGSEPQQYRFDPRLAATGLEVTDSKGTTQTSIMRHLPCQVPLDEKGKVTERTLAPGEKVTLTQELNLGLAYYFEQPGQYQIRFGGQAKKLSLGAEGHGYPQSNSLTLDIAEGSRPEIHQIWKLFQEVSFLPDKTPASSDLFNDHTVRVWLRERTNCPHCLVTFRESHDPPKHPYLSQGETVLTYKIHDVLLGKTKLGYAHLQVRELFDTTWPECEQQIKERLGEHLQPVAVQGKSDAPDSDDGN